MNMTKQAKRNNQTTTTQTAKALKGKALAKYRNALSANSTKGILQAEKERAQAEYLKRLESMTEEERLEELKKQENALPIINTETIDNESVQTMGERIAVKAIKTAYQASGNPFMLQLYSGLIVDILYSKKSGTAVLSDGYDIAQTAIAFLLNYKGHKLTETANNGKKDKDGNDITILRACFYAVDKYIMGERQREYKRAYVDDENGVTYEISFKWDLPTYTDFIAVKNVIEKLKLSYTEKRIFQLRMQGKSLSDIAYALSLAEGTVKTHCNRIKNKVKAIYGIDENTAKTAKAERRKETKKRIDESAKRNEIDGIVKIKAFDEKETAEKLFTLKRLYKKAKAQGQTETAEKIRRYGVKLAKAQRQAEIASKQGKIEKRLQKLIEYANSGNGSKN